VNKLKRYFGLAGACLLLSTAFIKVDVGSVGRFYSTLTPFGINGPTAAAFAVHPARRLWGPATGFLESLDRCRSRQTTQLTGDCSSVFRETNRLVSEHQTDLDAYDPGLAELLGSYFATKQSMERTLQERTRAANVWQEKSSLAKEEQLDLATKRALHVARVSELAARYQTERATVEHLTVREEEATWARREASAAQKRIEVEQRWIKAEREWIEAQRVADLLLGAHAPAMERRARDLDLADVVPSAFATAFDSRLRELESQIVPALKGYLVSKRPALAGLIFAAHLLLLLSFVLMAWQRDRVGAAILWPVTVLVGAGKEGAQAAKRFHEKV
jgi:hypothetical protein